MKIESFLPLCLAAAVALPVGAHAGDDIDYTYAEAGYFNWSGAEDGDLDLDVDGVQIRLLGQIHDYVHLRGEYVRGNVDISGFGDTDFDRFILGAGGHVNFSDTISGFFDLAYVDAEINSSPSDGIGKADTEGMLAEGGVRALVIEKLELDGSLGYMELGGASDVFIGLGGFYEIGGDFMLGASARVFTDSENGAEYFLGARFNF
jgi:hypothetical protein